MTWLQRYRVRHYLTTSIWIWPLLSMVAAIGAVRFLHGTDDRMGWESPLHPDTASQAGPGKFGPRQRRPVGCVPRNFVTTGA
jgi:hypothetical protein